MKYISTVYPAYTIGRVVRSLNSDALFGGAEYWGEAEFVSIPFGRGGCRGAVPISSRLRLGEMLIVLEITAVWNVSKVNRLCVFRGVGWIFMTRFPGTENGDFQIRIFWYDNTDIHFSTIDEPDNSNYYWLLLEICTRKDRYSIVQTLPYQLEYQVILN